jgi:hypothetical protein
MKLLNVGRRKADHASVLAADTILACELKNNGLTHWQYCAYKIARHYDVLPSSVGAKRH